MGELIFHSREAVESMTEDEARAVMGIAADTLRDQLEPTPYALPDLGSHHFLWSDDGVDYTEAATTHWSALWKIYFENDGVRSEEARKEIAQYLLTAPEEATDGELRLRIFDSKLLAEVWPDNSYWQEEAHGEEDTEA